MSVWIETKDGDPDAVALFSRHYSASPLKDGQVRRLFVGVGERLVLLTPEKDALFVWRHQKHRDDGVYGVECSVFRNESHHKSSYLISEAFKLARERWPSETNFFTFVNPRKVLSDNPGYCFKVLGWKQTGVTKRRKYIRLEYKIA